LDAELSAVDLRASHDVNVNVYKASILDLGLLRSMCIKSLRGPVSTNMATAAVTWPQQKVYKFMFQLTAVGCRK